jgi:hypothetical protein
MWDAALLVRQADLQREAKTFIRKRELIEML